MSETLKNERNALAEKLLVDQLDMEDSAHQLEIRQLTHHKPLIKFFESEVKAESAYFHFFRLVDIRNGESRANNPLCKGKKEQTLAKLLSVRSEFDDTFFLNLCDAVIKQFQ